MRHALRIAGWLLIMGGIALTASIAWSIYEIWPFVMLFGGPSNVEWNWVGLLLVTGSPLIVGTLLLYFVKPSKG